MFEQKDNNSQLQIDHVSKAYLLETVRWTKFMAIIGFIFLGFMILAGILFSKAISSTVGEYGNTTSPMKPIMYLFYIVVAALYFYPIYALLKFSTNMKTAIRTDSQVHLTEAFRFQKSMYKYIGILTVILLIMYGLVVLFAGVIMGAVAAGH